MLLVSAVPLAIKIGEELPQGVPVIAGRGSPRWQSTPSTSGDRRWPTGSPACRRASGMMYVAGMISGLLGIGSGTFKVLAMDTAMRLPMKVSTTTSNFMIGVTAAASAGIYFQRGDIHPLVAAPVALGVLLGATVGAKTLARLSNSTIRKIFIPLLVLIALEMLLRGMGVL